MTASAGAPPLELIQASLARDGKPVLDGVTATLHSGEFVGVLGPNGAGKSSLFLAILGLLPTVSGAIRVFGQAPRRGQERIGYLPQMRPDLAETDICAWDFVASALRPSHWGLPLYRAAERREVDAVIADVEAQALARRPLSALSGGERQRLLLAQALLGRPSLLLLDEPLINLDPRYQHTVVSLIQRLQVQRGMTVLFTSHELNPLLGAVGRVLYLGQRQAAIGTVEQVVTAPVLSRLYGMPIDVVRSGGRYFVIAAESGVPVESGGGHVHV